MSSPIEIFIAYSRKDSNLMEQLRTHLRPLEQRGMAKIWYDGIIEAGKDWKNEIKTHLDKAEIILLLISADFMDSDYCNDNEMLEAFKKKEESESKVIPIILRPCAWKLSLFAKMQVLPKDEKPVIEQGDYAFTEIVEAIAKICQYKNHGEKIIKIVDDFIEGKLPEEEEAPWSDEPSIADEVLSGNYFLKKSISKNENTFTDPRDGQVYKTVKLKDGKTWMAENLNYNLEEGACFYENNPTHGKNYGRLYQLSLVHEAIPTGWRIPTKKEWENMIRIYGEWEGDFLNKYNKAAFPFLIEGGNSKFDALYGGLRTDLNNFNYIGKFGNYWVAEKQFKFNNHYYVIQFERGLSKINIAKKDMEYALSVRCIKDE
ncbi:MAG: FISUMP domain-containing protein [Saprospiraceae bacterium]